LLFRAVPVEHEQDAGVKLPPNIRAGVAAVVSLLIWSCDAGRNPASPSATPETQAPPPAAQTFNLTGVVRQSAPTTDAVADVRIDVIDGPGGGRFAMSGSDGRYEFSGLVAGTLRLRASRNGYAPAEQVLALSGHTTLDFTIVRGAACALSGVVRESPGDAPSSGAVVALVKEPGGHSAPRIVSSATDASGSYRLGGVDCGVSRLLRVEKSDFSGAEVPVTINGETKRDVTISRVAYLLRGFVRESPSGTALANATVEVVSGPYAGQNNTTHADGSYGLQVRDTVTVRASKPGYVSREITVTVAAATNQDFSLSRQASTP
jgi:hypothetical protein